MTSASAFDVGPLTWVKSEIDLALERANQALSQFVANPGDATQIRFCRTHLHQVRGALAIVGLDGVTQFADAVENLLADLEAGRPAAGGDPAELVGGAIAAIRRYLDDLIAGEPNQPLRLHGVYAQLVQVRGLPAPSGSELFFPDLSIRPALRAMAPLAPGSGAQKLRLARTRFQKGLLAWLKSPQLPNGAQELQLAAVEIGSSDEAPVLRAFWWAVSGLFAAVAERTVADEAQVRLLLPRIDQQIRRQFEGSRSVPERLMRDVLYQVAVCRSQRAVVREIRRTYGLDALLPEAAAGDRGAGLEPVIKRLREIATAAEDAWSRFCSGNTAAIDSFRDAAGHLHQGSERLGHTDFRRLTQALAATATWVGEQPSRHSEPLALEIATAILLIDNALDNFAHLGSDFVHQVDVVVARLHACIAGAPLAADMELPGLDDMTRRAQERLLIAQVVREIQSNLGQVEQALDTFFRDPAQRDALASLKAPLHQIEGALTILGQDDAVAALHASSEQIERFADADYVARDSDFEAVARQLSGLGFFVESLQSGGGDYRSFIASLEAAPGERQAARENLFAATEESPAAAPAAPPAPAAAPAIVAPPAVATPAAVAAPEPPPAAAPTPPPAAAAAVAEAAEAGVDAELLEIFLEEAGEVLASIAENLAALRQRAGDGEALTTVRRAFHTLKGSSRMVGLKDFGEVAWAIEQVHNQWLRQELKVGDELLDLIAAAHEVFSAWVAHLSTGEGRLPDAAPLVARADALRGVEAAAPAPEVRAEPIPEVAPEPARGEMPAAAPEISPEAAPEVVAETAPEVALKVPTEPAAPPEGVSEAAPATAAAPEPPPRQTIVVSPTLREIFQDEARSHVAALQRHFGDLEIDPAAPTAIDMVRAAHTLGSIAGTVGLPGIKRLGHALEEALLRRNHCPQRDSLQALETVRLAIAELDQLLAAAAADAPLAEPSALLDNLAEIYPQTAVAAVEAAPEAALLTSYPAAAEAEPLPEDALDPQLLPIFVEEAADLVAGIGERLNRWRENPADTDSIHALARHLHTLKGSARMTGAHRLGALTHRLESRVEQAHRAGGGDAGLVAEIQADFDDLVPLIDALRTAPVAPPAAEPIAAAAAPAASAPAAVKAPPPAPEPLPADHLDEQLLPIFLDEATELTQAVYGQLEALRADPGDAPAAHGLARALHTIKGSARMAGAMSLGALTHALETRIETATHAGGADAALINELRDAFDGIAQVIERLRHGETAAPIGVEVPAAAAVAAPAPSGETGVAEPLAAAAAPAKPREEAAPKAMLRVRADLVDALVNDAGELSIARARIEGEMRGLKQSLLDLTENVIRLRRQLREIEIQAESQMQSRIALASDSATQFDPLELDRFTRFQELTRMMAESVNDVATVQQNLLKNLDEANAALVAQSRLNRELQQQLMAVRMVPFAGITERLYRIVRQTARELGKRTDLEIRGSQIELDQNVINTMIGPFEHLLRNAIAHGIETPEARRAAGKNEMGEIVLTLRHEGNEVVITMSDDGGGLHYDAIRARAIERGLLRPDAAADHRRLAEMIFESGFSTAREVTQVSGRGIGMDVVKTEVGRLGGRIDVSSDEGRGTVFRIYLPLTLAVTNAVLVRAGSRSYAIPATMIDQVQEIRADALARLHDAGQAEWQGNVYPFHFLPQLLGEPEALPETRKLYWVLLLHSGAQRVAVQVDELQRAQEIVVKNIGPQLSRVVGIAGATVLGDGRVVLILNPVALAARRPLTAPPPATAPAAAEAPALSLPTVLVVDDSLTVRKITGRLLAREGYQVISAKDGVDALEQLTELTPDVIISDIEMPRMDGFELARNIRGDERLRHIPMIMITSRTADKHRSHALEIGVNDYLGKPYQEEELLALVRRYVGERRRH